MIDMFQNRKKEALIAQIHPKIERSKALGEEYDSLKEELHVLQKKFDKMQFELNI